MDGLWVMPFILGFITFGIIFLACFITYASSQQQQKRVINAATAASLTKDNIIRIFSSEAGGLPTWLRHLDSDHPTFVNQAMSVLWPHIDRAATSWAFKDRNLENLLNEQDFWKPSWLAASGVVLQSLELGQTPPNVTGLKVYSTTPGAGDVKPDSLTVDIDFDWLSKLNCIIVMKTLQTTNKRSIADKVLSVVYKAITIKVVVKNIVARGQLRIIAAPLLGEIPVIGAIRASFLGPPTISYDVSSFGLSPMFIPGLESWIQSFITGHVLQPFTFPEALELNIAELFGVAAIPPPIYPQGVLSVTIHGVDNVPRMDMFGAGADPYMKIFATKKLKQRTSVKAKTRFPKWEETFDIIVHDEKYQQLTLEVWDSDQLSRDDMVGRVVLPLNSPKLDLMNEKVNNLELTLQRLGRKEAKKGRPMYVEDDGTSGDIVNNRGGAGNQSMVVRRRSFTMNRGEGEEEKRIAAAAAGPSMLADAARQGLEDLHILKERKCTISCSLQFFKFTSQEAEAAKNAHDGRHLVANNLSPRVSRLLRGGMLYIHLLRAEGLSPNTGVTKTYKLFVKVGPRDGAPVYKKSAERRGMGRGLDARSPVFDERVDMLVDGDTAQRRDTVITVEIWVKHFLLKPSYKGAVTLPLSSVLMAGKMRETWVIEGGSGAMEMGLEWQGMMHAI
ncbi:putative Synaptotagmin-3 [Nannochloris sp. 'desiccata']|nr:putative Synaptotagmin-3 [Chlorella desiccata (nom. nud.)]